jgi:hypothetical protein
VTETSDEIVELGRGIRFDPEFVITGLTPAAYNPRSISDEAFLELRKSLREMGLIKPVILNGDFTLIAGHQRTKAAQAEDMTTFPAVILPVKISMNDEVMFNLMHNRIEVAKHPCRLPPSTLDGEGWEVLEYEEGQLVEGDADRAAGFIIQIAGLLSRYGAWGSIVASASGEILLNAEYALAAHDLRMPLLVYRVDDSRAVAVHDFLDADYGRYDWSRIQTDVANQQLIQPKRLRRPGIASASVTWHYHVVPTLTKEERIVDFGAGQADYSRDLSKRGYDITWYEPFPQAKGRRAVDIQEVVRREMRLRTKLAKDGLFQTVILDSVINGTTSKDYQEFVLATCNALCQVDGRLVLGTRTVDSRTGGERAKRIKTRTARPGFLDEDNVELSFREGVWATMRFHTNDSIYPILKRYFGTVEMLGVEGANLCARCTDPLPLPEDFLLEALTQEFNMPYPSGDRDNPYHHNRHEGLVSDLMALVAERDRERGHLPMGGPDSKVVAVYDVLDPDIPS